MMDIEKLKKAGLLLLFCSNLGFLAAAFYFHQDNFSLRDQLQEITAARDAAVSEKVALLTENSSLQNRLKSRPETYRNADLEIANLEKLLDLREEELADLKKQLAGAGRFNGEGPSQADGGSRRRRPETMPDRLARLKEENPAEYDQIQKRREEFQKRREEQTARRELFFKTLDVSKLSSDQRRLLSEYQDLLAGSDEMLNSFWQGGQQSDFREMMEQGRTLREMSETVREILLQNLGNQTGLAGEALSSSVKEILEMTTPWGGRFQSDSGSRRR